MHFFRRWLSGGATRRQEPNPVQSVYLGDHVLLIRTQAGHKIYADSRDLSVVPTLVFKGRWEPWVSRVMLKTLRRGMRVADVGAHIGYHTCVMAKAVGRTGFVHAIEANPRLTALLRKTIAANGYNEYVSCHEVVAGAETGQTDFHMFRGLTGSSSVLPMQETAARYGDAVDVARLNCEPLDAIVGTGGLDAMKIDCEGSEPAIVTGARSLLDGPGLRHIFMEYSPYFYRDRDVPVRMFAELERRGFRFETIERSGEPQRVSREQVLAQDRLVDIHLFRE